MKLKTTNITASLLLLTSLSACSTPNNGSGDNTGVDSVHKATVALQESSHPISFASSKLSENEEASLAAFISSSGLRYSDRLTLRTSEPNMSVGYRNAVNAVLGRFGLAIGNVEVVIGLQSGSAILAVSRPTVTLPECGVHSGPNTLNPNNEKMSNYGCATRSNLAAMAANPADLVSGNVLDGQSADVTAKPVEAFGGRSLTGIEMQGKKKNWTPQGPTPK